MIQTDRLSEFLQELTPLSRSCLLGELERLELCGIDIPGSSDILAKLRAEFRKDGSLQSRAGSPLRHFFMPLESFLTDSAPEHANPGRISRSSLVPVWEWICRDLLPTMARDYSKAVGDLDATHNSKELLKIASAFQTKIVKVLENSLGSSDGAELARAKLAQYTAARTAFDDVVKMLHALRARDALEKFNAKLPERISKFDNGQVARIAPLLDSLRKANADAVPFALTLVAKRLKTSWQLIRLATKAAASKNAEDIAITPYAIAVTMALDQLDDKRTALRIAFKHNRVLVAKDLLTEIYDTEYALQVRIDQFEQSNWGLRLRQIMDGIAALVEAEVSRFPEEVGHIFASRRLRTHQSLSGRLTYLAWRGRDVVQEGAAFCRKMIGQT
ncbi:hypothetical protein [Bradyrhizobium sp. AUGA SZCCT0283]|uniref:hypothetical protein n=1 Tax=Bradyrhizobium sp. AUGA SZCCT0283 TaxID=2807671 RepID=UPI001BA4CFC7|nr:hypothetical protein [Bradyrhizobium sp. AUGA SZCCT0283]MBR1275592.1 hypothetical protein [Bradyrhizobium sp. AUGA SZCCT0283]